MSRDTSPNAAPSGLHRLGADEVARMGYGAKQLRRDPKTRLEVIAVLRRAIDLGVDQFYADGRRLDVGPGITAERRSDRRHRRSTGGDDLQAGRGSDRRDRTERRQSG